MIEIKQKVMDGLKANSDKWQIISDETGISIHTLIKIGNGKTKNPGIDHMEKLYNFFNKGSNDDSRQAADRRINRRKKVIE